MNTDRDNNNTSIFKKTSDYEPGRNWRDYLIGKPLQTAEAPHQAIGKLVGLAVFSSDALSSVAYATQEMMLILAAAGAGALHFSIPIVFAILGLLVILTLSYRQTIHAYPSGGGAYIVARDNLGELPAQTAGASLLMDYVLTVAVSISSGVAQLTSAFPALYPQRVIISVSLILFVMLINLRGVKESGIIFAIPTYFFLIMMYITVIFGFIRLIANPLLKVEMPPMDFMTESTLMNVSLFLILKAFSSGTTALTGVEAISNGIMAFKEPRSKNAGITLVWMSTILGSLLLGITILANQFGTLPSDKETVISQIGRTVFTNPILYLAVITSTTLILVMAANTAYADFPRLSALIANDGFLPRQLNYRGSRLVFSRGIVLLAFVACILVIIFKASVSKLIPLYAIGVFLSFTLSQFGMAIRWWKLGHLKPGEEIIERGSTLRYEDGWQTKMVINGFGSLCTGVVMTVFAITKFKDGAWIVVLLIPMLISVFYTIHRHYKKLAKQLSLENYVPSTRISHQRVIMPISGVHKGTLAALRYAKTLSDDITVVHISSDPDEVKRLQEKWELWGDGYRLVVLDSPYRVFVEPLLNYIDDIDSQKQPNEVISIVVPQFVPKNKLANLLHTRTADALRHALLNRKDIVIMEVPYQVD